MKTQSRPLRRVLTALAQAVHAPTRRTCIEPLEARIAPATATYIGPNGGSWETGGNWDIGRVPGSLPADATDLDVVINPAAGEFTVNYSANLSVRSLTMAGDDHLTIAGGTLTLGASSSIANGFTLGPGSLNAGPDFVVAGTTTHSGGNLGGTVTNHGAWTWFGGSVSAQLTNASDGTFELAGVANKRLQGGVFNNAGMLNVSGSDADVHGGGAYNNLVSGVVNITTDNGIFGTDGSGNFNNAGTVQKIAGAGQTYFGNTRFNNAATGIVTVTSGSLFFAAGGTSTGGTFTAIAGSQIQFSGNHTWSGTFTGSGAGAVQLFNTHISPGAGGLTLDFSIGGLEFGGASFIDGGTVTNTGLIKTTSNFQVFRLNGTTFNNTGTVRVQQPDMFWENGATFNNQVGGLFDIQTDGTGLVASGDVVFNNAGTVQKSAGAGAANFDARLNNQSDGMIDVDTGELRLRGGGTFSGAAIDVAGGAQLTFSNTGQTWSGTLTGGGTGAVVLSGIHISPGAGGVTLNFPANQLQFSNVSYFDGGTVTNTGFATVTGNNQAFRLNGATFLNEGTVTVPANARMEMHNNSVFTNQTGHLLRIEGDNDAIAGDGTGAFNNFGTIQRSVGTGTATVGAKLNNQPVGILDVDTGELRFVGGGTSTGAEIDVAAGAQLTFSNTGQTWSGTFTGTGAGAVVLGGIHITPATGGLTLNFAEGLLQFSNISYFDGGTVTNTGFAQVTGNNQAFRLNSATFLNAGTVTIAANARMEMHNNAVFTNQMGHLLRIEGDNDVIAGDGTGAFSNFGTIQRAAGAGTATSNAKLNNQPGGIIDVDTGELRFVGGGTSTGAAIDVAGGAQLTFSNTGQTWSGTFTGSGAGAVVLNGISISPGAGGLTLNFASGLLRFGDVSVFTGGTITNLGFGRIVGNNSPLRLAGAVFNNAGTIIVENNGFYGEANAKFNNLVTGVFDVRTDGQISNSDGSAVFNNAGEISKTAGAGTSFFDMPMNNSASGVIDVDTGELQFRAGGASTGAKMEVAGGAQVTFTGGNKTWSGNFTGNGAGVVNIVGTTTTAGAAGLTLDFPAGMLRLGTDSYFNGSTITNLGFVRLTGGGSALRLVGTTFNNAGTVEVANVGFFTTNGATFNNLATGVFDIQADGNAASSDGSGIFNNFGLIKKTGGTEATFLTSSFGWKLNNSGVVEARFGRLDIGDLPQLAGNTLTGGIWRVIDDDPALPNSELRLPQNVVTNAAVITLDGTATLMPQLGALGTNNGTLELRGGRDFTRSGAFTNNGTLSMGPASNLNVNGAFTAGANSRLEFLLGGTPVSGNFGTLTVGGAAALAGTAVFTLADGYGPANGQTFTLANFASHSGAFTAYEGIRLQRTDLFQPVLNATNLTLNAIADVGDLDVTTVSAPPTGLSGNNATITWTVMNNGPLPTFTTTWTDRVYLSLDDRFDASDKLIGEVVHNGGLGVGGSYNAMLTAPLPGVVPGGYKVLVIADSRGQEPDRDRTNNDEISGTIAMDMTALTPGVALPGTIANGQEVWVRIILPAGQTPHFTATYGAAGAAEFYVRQFATPDRANYDRFEFSPGSATVDFTQFNGSSGTYYILLHGREAAGAGQTFSVTAEGLPFGISDLDVTQGANLGSITTVIHGSLFTPQTIFTLVPTTGPGIPASTLTYVDGSTVWATFNLNGATLGAYDVVASSPGASDTLDDGFNVVVGVPGKFTYSLSAPTYIRAPFKGAVVTLTYENTGDTDIGAPLVLISSRNATFFPPTFSGGKDNFFELLAVNPDGPAGVLPPGAKGTIQIPFVPQVQTAHALSPITASVMDAAGITIDWDTLKDDLQPLGVPGDAYDQIFANFKAQVGGNYATYVAALDADATRLSLLGQRTFDPGVFVSFEMQEAGNFGQLTDRYTFGLFGRGPVALFETELITDTAGNVAVQLGGDVRNFAKLANGSYLSMPGDNAVLTKDGGGLYHLVEGNGLETVFRADGKFLSNTDRDGKSLTAAYNGIGQIVSLTVSDDNPMTVDEVATFTLDANGKIATKTDTLGRVTTYTYDGTGQHLLSSTNAAGTTAYTYATTPGATHAFASITHPNGTHTFFQYDTRGRLIEQTRDGGAEKLTYTYDDAGGITATDALGHATRVFHDATGSIGRVIDPMGGFGSATFDLAGNLTGTTNRAGASAKLGTGGNNLPSSFIGAGAGNIANFDFDGAVDGLQSFTHGGGGTTSYSYDAAGNVITITRPDGTTLGYRYDTSGNITQIINANSEVTVLNYDTHGNLTGRVYSDGSTVAFTYDGHRNLKTATDATGTITYSYDAADRVTKVAYPGGQFVGYTYDAFGRRTSLLDQDGIGTKFLYDAVGRLGSITDQNDVTVTSYTYDAAGQLATETQANGTVTEYTRDALGRVIAIVEKVGAVTQSTIAYTYDTGGHIATSTDTGGTTSYSYDPIGQLAQVALPGGRTITYTYDAQGNRTSVNDSAAGTTAYTANSVDEYTSAGTTTYTYDLNGRVSTKTGAGVTTIYQYDARGRLARQFSPTENIAYEYDALGNLRATTNAAGERTNYLVDPTGAGNVVAEYNGAGALLAHYRRGAGLESRADGAGAQAFYHFDSIGNTTQLTGAAGAVLNTYSYLPFGEKLAETESVENPFTFNGRDGVQDLDDGFYFMHARNYDPALGRFTEGDPLGIFGGDTNFYRFANNNPVNFNDPSGLAAPVLGGFVSAVQTVVGPISGGLALPFSGLAPGAAGTTGLGLGGFASSTLTETGAFLSTDGIATTSAIEWTTAYAPALAPAGGGIAEATVGSSLLTAAGETLAVFGPPALLAAAIAGPILAVDAIKARENSYARVEDPFSAKAGYGNDHFRPRDIMDSPKVREVIEKNGFDPKKPDDVNIAIRGVNDLTRERQYENDHFNWVFNGMKGPEPQPPALPGVVSETLQSGDPNNLYGPSGFAADAIADNPNTQPTRFEGFVKPNGDFAYQVVFENMPTASAPAQFVEVTQMLDGDLDPTTLHFTSFGWGDVRVDVPANHPLGAGFTQRVDVLATYGIYVDVAATIDTVTGAVRVTFTAVDPTTGDLPLDPLAGFLPPNITPPEGDGFINYTVQPDAGLADGTEIKGKARIVFDTNPFIDTPEITNKTDALAPASSIIAFAQATTPRTTFKVQWSGDDASGGSGLAYFDVYYTDDGGPQQLLFGQTTATAGRFTGEVGHTYAFFVTATDNVGNLEPVAAADQSISVVAPTFLDVGKKRTFIDADGDKVTVQYSGPGTAKVALLDPDGDGNGPIDFLQIDGSTKKSKVTVTVKKAAGGDGAVPIGDAIVNGTLAAFTAKQSDLVVNGLLASGSVKTIAVRDVLQPDAVLADPLLKLAGAATDSTTIAARTLADGFAIQTPGVIKKLTAQGIGDGIITAAALKNLLVKTGNLNADIVLAGALGPVTIKKGGIADATITALKIGNLTVKTDVLNAIILAGANLGADGALGGGDDTFASSTIGKVGIGGSVTASVLGAGFSSTDGIFKNADDAILGGTASKIAALTIKGQADAASYFAAGKVAKKPKIAGVVINPATDQRFLVG